MANLDLFDTPAPAIIPAFWPTAGTKTHAALTALIESPTLTQAEFRTSWRLAAYVDYLKKSGWAIYSRLITPPGWSATIAQYSLDRADPATAAALRQKGVK